jgi:hypothetical protein
MSESTETKHWMLYGSVVGEKANGVAVLWAWEQLPSLEALGMGRSERDVLMALMSFTHRITEGTEAWPSRKTLQRMSGLSRTEVRRSLDNLELAEVIRSSRRYAGEGNASSLYTIRPEIDGHKWQELPGKIGRPAKIVDLGDVDWGVEWADEAPSVPYGPGSSADQGVGPTETKVGPSRTKGGSTEDQGGGSVEDQGLVRGGTGTCVLNPCSVEPLNGTQCSNSVDSDSLTDSLREVEPEESSESETEIQSSVHGKGTMSPLGTSPIHPETSQAPDQPVKSSPAKVDKTAAEVLRDSKKLKAAQTVNLPHPNQELADWYYIEIGEPARESQAAKTTWAEILAPLVNLRGIDLVRTGMTWAKSDPYWGPKLALDYGCSAKFVVTKFEQWLTQRANASERAIKPKPQGSSSAQPQPSRPPSIRPENATVIS